MRGTSMGWKRSGVITAAGAVALLGSGVFAVPASAHTPTWSVTCDKVTIDLTLYNARVTNTVTAKAGGKELLPTRTFPDSFHTVLDLPAHSGEESVELVVKAGDGDRYSVDQTKIAPVCAGVPASPSATASVSPSAPAKPSAVPSTGVTATLTASSSAAAPATPSPSSSSNLAETGASSATPVIAAVAAAVLAAGAGLLVIGRRRRAGAR